MAETTPTPADVLNAKFLEVEKDLAVTKFDLSDLISVHPRVRRILDLHGLDIKVQLVLKPEPEVKLPEESKENGNGKTEKSSG